MCHKSRSLDGLFSKGIDGVVYLGVWVTGAKDFHEVIGVDVEDKNDAIDKLGSKMEGMLGPFLDNR